MLVVVKLPTNLCGQDLDKAREGLCLDSDLHLCYLITPRSEDVCRNWETCCNVIRSVQVPLWCKARKLLTVACMQSCVVSDLEGGRQAPLFAAMHAASYL